MIHGINNGGDVAIQAVLVGGFEAGIGVVTAKGFNASWEQAAVFTTVNKAVWFILESLVCSYIQNTRQLALATIVIQTTSGLAGILATRLFCQNAIHWKSALASAVCSDTAAGYACVIFTKSRPLEPFIKMLES